jgi:hypothetical protein
MKRLPAIVTLCGFHVLALVLLVAVSGCMSTPARLSNSDRLIRHPQFNQAAQAAPEFVSEALKTINRLEQEIERR